MYCFISEVSKDIVLNQSDTQLSVNNLNSIMYSNKSISVCNMLLSVLQNVDDSILLFVLRVALSSNCFFSMISDETLDSDDVLDSDDDIDDNFSFSDTSSEN